ncbi:MAG: methyl-accepting chemotaxis protein [Methyloligellaceae bacterium]
MKQFLGNSRLGVKLPVLMVSLCFLLAVSLGGASIYSAYNNSESLIESKVNALLKSRKHELKNYLLSLEQDIRSLSVSPATIESIKEFTASWANLGSNQTKILQDAYINNNPHPVGQKEKLDAASTVAGYDELHAKYHPYFRKFLKERGYYDIFLFDTKGNLVYSVFKELDFATNLNTGQWKDSDLGNVFRAGMQQSAPFKISFYDFKPYAPSNNAPASFLSTSIFENGTKVGVLVFQMPIDAINEIMHSSAGLGKAGEMIIIGQDKLFRNDSKFSKENDILKSKLDNDTVRTVFEGKAHNTITSTYRNLNMSFFGVPLKFETANWALIAALSVDEIYAPVYRMMLTQAVITLVLLLFIGICSILVSRSVTKPILRLVQQMKSLAGGDTSFDIYGQWRKDEIGDMSNAVSVFRENAIDRQRLEIESIREKETIQQRQKDLEGFIYEFRNEVEVALTTVDSDTAAMQATARDMTQTANSTNATAESAVDSSSNASSNVATVASAAEELSASITEISGRLSQTMSVVKQATEKTQTTDTKVISLTNAAQKIGDVINLIQDIAEQTNLLALNATIEAARAGEAGKGFAVVATEVKSLAEQTAKATSEISEQITNIQTETEEAAKAINEIADVMSEVNNYTSSIAEGIEQQGEATTEISSSILQAAGQTKDTVDKLGIVKESVNKTVEAADTVLGSSNNVSTQAKGLQKLINEFLEKVAAA